MGYTHVKEQHRDLKFTYSNIISKGQFTLPCRTVLHQPSHCPSDKIRLAETTQNDHIHNLTYMIQHTNQVSKHLIVSKPIWFFKKIIISDNDESTKKPKLLLFFLYHKCQLP